MFIAFYKEYQHGRDRDNYDTMDLADSGVITCETLDSLLDEMFKLNEHHRKSVKPKNESFSYEYTSIEWLGVHEIDIKETFYQEYDHSMDWDYDGCTTEKELLKMIENSKLGKKAAEEKATKHKQQAEKRKLNKEVRRQKLIAKEQNNLILKEQYDRDEYKRLKAKYEGDE